LFWLHAYWGLIFKMDDLQQQKNYIDQQAQKTKDDADKTAADARQAAADQKSKEIREKAEYDVAQVQENAQR
jgi:hypothetical protein